MAHRRGARRAHRPRLVVRRLVPAGLALLLRPHLRGARPRAGLRAARRPVRLVPGPRAADAAVRASRRTSSRTYFPPGHHAGAVRADQQRHRRGGAVRRPRRDRPGHGRADAGPARVDAAAGAAHQRACSSASAAGPSASRAARRRSASTSAAATTPTALREPRPVRPRPRPAWSAATIGAFERPSARWARTTTASAPSASTSPARASPAVSDDGSDLLVAPVDAARRRGPTVVVSGAVDLAAPSWDYRDRIWVLDRGAGRARVILVVDGVAPRSSTCPG